jgi:hypothetical protein
MINRKAQSDELMLMPVILFVMLIIAIGIVAGFFLYFGNGYESRSVDASALNYKIRECFFNKQISDIQKDIFSTCSINKNAVESNKMFFKICQNMSAEECSSSSNKIVSAGSNFESCFFIGTKNNNNYPKCAIEEFYLDGNQYSIIAGSNQEMRREKQ